MAKFNVTLEVKREDGYVALFRKVEINDYSESSIRSGKALARKWLDKLLGVL